MPLLLRFTTPTGDSEYPLPEGRASVGSAPECAIVLRHPEVPSHAVTIDVTGDSVVVSNAASDYSIYVGQDEVGPGQPSAWAQGDSIALTASTLLTLVRPGGAAASESPAAPASSSKKATQLGVIALCAVIGLQQSMMGPSESAAAPRASFAELRLEVQQKVDSELAARNLLASSRWAEALRLLQEARYFETRFGNCRPEDLVAVYQRLLDSEVLIEASQTESGSGESAGDSLAERLVGYATAKKAQFER